MFHLRRVSTERSVTWHWREVREVEVTNTSTTASTTASSTTGSSGSRHHGGLLGQIILLDLRGEVGRGSGGVVVRRLVLANNGRDVVAEGRRRGRDVGAGPGTSNVRILERLLRNKSWRRRETWRMIMINNSESADSFENQIFLAKLDV